MSYDFSSISADTIERPPRIIINGLAKIGKSTFASSAPNPIVIAIQGEDGIDAINVATWRDDKKRPIPCRSITELFQRIEQLSTAEHSYRTVVIDSATTLDRLVLQEALIREGVKEPINLGGGYGHQSDTICKIWMEISECFEWLRNERDMTVIMTGHVVVKTSKNPLVDKYDAYSMDINTKAGEMLFQVFDCLLFANKKVNTSEEDAGFNRKRRIAIDNTRKDRKIYTQAHPSYPAGGRGVYGMLPNEIDLCWESFQAAVDEAKALMSA